jgi:hypothetical protein
LYRHYLFKLHDCHNAAAAFRGDSRYIMYEVA